MVPLPKERLLLGSGEYSHPLIPAEYGRWLFLRSVALFTPEVIHDLLLCPLDEAGMTERSLPDAPPRWIGGLTDELLAWARKYWLSDPWCWDFAIATLLEGRPSYIPYCQRPWPWEDDPIGRNPKQRFLFGLSPTGRSRPHLRSGWHPALETREKARRRILAQFEQALERYLDRMEGIAAGEGLIKTPIKLADHYQTGDEYEASRHFRWLALHQCRGVSFTALSQEANIGKGRSTISEACCDLAQLIGLTPRRSSGGRPPNQNTSSPRHSG